jgi:hypothetical protein
MKQITTAINGQIYVLTPDVVSILSNEFDVWVFTEHGWVHHTDTRAKVLLTGHPYSPECWVLAGEVSADVVLHYA